MAIRKTFWISGLMAGIVLSAGLTAQGGINQTKASKIKSAYIYNFIKFTQWPKERFKNDKSPIMVGFIGQGAFASILKATLKGKIVRGRPLVFKQLSHPKIGSPDNPAPIKKLSLLDEQLKTCHVLYIDLNFPRLRRYTTKSLAGFSALTVFESKGTQCKLPMICLSINKNKIVFDVNAYKIKKSHIRLSSRLMKLARSVRQKEES